MKHRWIVRNRYQTARCGNGVWTRHHTKLGALRSLERIRTFRHGTGQYIIPAGGLVVCRASQAFDRAGAPKESGHFDTMRGWRP